MPEKSLLIVKEDEDLAEWYLTGESTVQLLKESKLDRSITQMLQKVQLKYKS